VRKEMPARISFATDKYNWLDPIFSYVNAGPVTRETVNTDESLAHIHPDRLEK
jgi:hypothetical protein